MSSRIQAVIFDVGGVLVRTLDHGYRLRWDERLGVRPGESEDIYFNSQMQRQAQLGRVTYDTLWRWTGHRLSLGDELEAFHDDFWRGDSVDGDLVSLVAGLRPRYRTAIVSNAPDSLMKFLRCYDLIRHFDVIVGSAYEQVMKPDQAIYRLALTRLDVSPEASVFIDDVPENVETATTLGMQAIRFTPDVDVAQALASLGVSPAC